MTFEEWAKEYFSKIPVSEDTRREYAAAQAAWDAAIEACRELLLG